MKNILAACLSAFVLLASGCLPAMSDSTVIPSSPITEIAPTTVTAVAPMPSGTPQSAFVYQRICLTIETTLPPGALSEGAILLGYELAEGVQPYFLNTLDENIQIVSDMSTTGVKIVSPDGRLLAYEVERAGNRFLEVSTADGQLLQSVLYSRQWSRLLYWLDNEQVAIAASADYSKGAIINIVTGESTEFDLSALGTSVKIFSFPQFDPTLTRVISMHNAEESGMDYLALWDWQTRRELWRLEVKYSPWDINPQWSPDGRRFAVGGPVERPDDLVYELLIVDYNGQAEQVTQFKTSEVQEGMILNPQWSPDGRYVAFWFDDSLAVYDSSTGIVTDYCLLSTEASTLFPTWSPDSRQIAFGTGRAYYVVPEQVIVVDIQESEAFEVAGTYAVLGWMTTLP